MNIDPQAWSATLRLPRHHLSVHVAALANAVARDGEFLVSALGAGVQVWVMAVDEALVLAGEAENIVRRDAAGGIHE